MLTGTEEQTEDERGQGLGAAAAGALEGRRVRGRAAGGRRRKAAARRTPTSRSTTPRSRPSSRPRTTPPTRGASTREYVAAKQALGENVSNIPQDRFHQRLCGRGDGAGPEARLPHGPLPGRNPGRPGPAAPSADSRSARSRRARAVARTQSWRSSVCSVRKSDSREAGRARAKSPRPGRRSLGGDPGARAHAARPRRSRRLLPRFTFYVDPSITDQEEKDAAFDGIVATGRGRGRAGHRVPAQGRVDQLADQDPRAHPERADVVVEKLLALLADMDTEYERDPQRKIQMLATLEERRTRAWRRGRALPRGRERDRALPRGRGAARPGRGAERHRDALLRCFCRRGERARAQSHPGRLRGPGWDVGDKSAEVKSRLPPATRSTARASRAKAEPARSAEVCQLRPGARRPHRARSALGALGSGATLGQALVSRRRSSSAGGEGRVLLRPRSRLSYPCGCGRARSAGRTRSPASSCD